LEGLHRRRPFRSAQVCLGLLVQFPQALFTLYCLLHLGQERFCGLSLILWCFSPQLIQQVERIAPVACSYGCLSSPKLLGPARLLFSRRLLVTMLGCQLLLSQSLSRDRL